MAQPKRQKVWNDFQRISKTRKPRRCAITGLIIPAGSSCWQFIGEWRGDFQSWYCSDEAKDFIDNNHGLVYDWDGLDCQSVGDMMRERGLIA